MSKPEIGPEYDTVFELDGHRFRVARSFEAMFGADTSEELLLAKSPAQIELYRELAGSHRAERIFELGIFRGGSAALFHALFKPRKLVAIDRRDESSEALAGYQRAQPEGSLVCHYGVEQADTARLEQILTLEFSNEPLDLVVDDASHLLEETTRSFNLLFPRLRPGGLYVIEDWPWAHYARDPGGATAGDLFPQFQGQPALSSLVVEALLACGTGNDLVERVTVNRYCAVVRRGPGDPEDDGFDIRRAYRLSRGSPVVLRAEDTGRSDGEDESPAD